jgi:hypothetical protein
MLLNLGLSESVNSKFEATDKSDCVGSAYIAPLAAVVSRSRVCIVTNMWLSDPQTTPMLRWHSSRSTEQQWFCGYPARCSRMVLGKGELARRGSRNRLRKSWKGQVNQGINPKKLLSAQRFMNKTSQPCSLRRNVAYSHSSSSTIE